MSCPCGAGQVPTGTHPSSRRVGQFQYSKRASSTAGVRPYNLEPAAPVQKKTKKQKLTQGRLSCCRCAELLNSLGASDVGSKCEMTSCGVSPAANRTLTCRLESVCCSHGVRLSAARMRAYASARVRFLLCSRSHCSSIPKFSGLRRCGFAPEARNFLGTRHAEKMVASMTFMTSKSSRIVVSKVHGVNTVSYTHLTLPTTPYV